MSLKKLISIKLVTYLIVLLGMLYITSDTVKYYRDLENDNKILIKQNKLYERMATLAPNDDNNRTIIKSELKLLSKLFSRRESSENDYDKLFWLIVYLCISMGILRFIDEKIEKKKNAIKDVGEML